MSFRKIETLISLTKGKKPLNILQNIEDSYLPYVDIKAFETGIVDNYTDGEKCVSCNEGDLLIVCDGSRSGLVGKAITGYVGSTLARIDVSDEIDINYLYYFIQGKYQILNTNVKGTGTPHLKQDLLKSFNIYLPPIEKQKLIVAKIEKLFSKLDKGVEELNKIKEQLKIYRQAVLDQAFDNNETEVHLRDISTVISGYAFKSGLYDANGKYVVVKIGNVKQHSFDFSRDLTKTNEANDNILSKYLLKKGDCLITMTGSRGKRDYGFVTMIDKEENFLLNQRVAALRFDKISVDTKFFEYYLSTTQFRNQFFSYETGNVGQGNVGVKALTESTVICPKIELQKHIVKEIESRLSVCEKIEQTVNESLQKAESLRQSILKKAFEGKLV